MTSIPSNEKRENSPFPQRKRPASGVHIAYDEPTIVFVTVCTRERSPWLAQEEAHGTLIRVWEAATAWLVGFYLLMPDHVHFFVAPHDMDIKLDNWITYWKSMFTRHTPKLEWRWQSGKWDTRLRRSENYQEKWEYIRQNPVRKGLASCPEDWPYHGKLNNLRW